MIRKSEPVELRPLVVRNSPVLAPFSLRETMTATLIREEAAESLLPEIQGYAELQALNQVLNRYSASWWLKHLSSVGGDPASYWRAQLGEEIKIATRGKDSTRQRKGFFWRFCHNFTSRVTYELSDLEFDPF